MQSHAPGQHLSNLLHTPCSLGFTPLDLTAGSGSPSLLGWWIKKLSFAGIEF